MVWGDGGAQRAFITDRMTRTHHEIETMTRRLELEKRRLKRIEKELEAARKTYQIRVLGSAPKKALDDQPAALKREHSSAVGETKTYASTETPAAETATASTAVAAPMRALLNRLDVQRSKLDGMNHDNIALRHQVDEIRRRRLSLNTIFQGLKAEIKQRTAQLADTVEEAAGSKTVHENAEQRVGVMKRHRELERRQFKKEVLRLREQLKLQDWERKEVEVQLQKADTGIQKKNELIIPDEETTFSEGEMMRRIMKTAFLNCIQRRHIKNHQRSIEVFNQAFLTIKQTTGIEHIEEIVKIFVNLESRNYSLLTYVNVMNREIEALEGIRRERQQTEVSRQRAEEHHGQVRQQALSEMERQLHISKVASHESREAISQHCDLIEDLKPILAEIAERIQHEFSELRRASASTNTSDEQVKFPNELREENFPEWLELIEMALGRFRDLLPESDGAFPCTANDQVRKLPPKRLGGQAPPQALIKKEELPDSRPLLDEQGAQKRTHVQMTAAQKAELLDEESEEEDFENRPLNYKDLRTRAENSAERRKGRGRKREGFAASVSPTPKSRSSHIEGNSSASATMNSTASRQSNYVSAALGETQVYEKEDEPFVQDHGKSEVTTEFSKDPSTMTASNSEPQKQGTVLGVSGVSNNTDEEQTTAGSPPKKFGRGMLAQGAVQTSEEDVDERFLQRYKMTREELEIMADHMGIHLQNLCFLKQEFDHYDQDQSGYIDTRELKNLLRKLGEDLDDEEALQAFKQLDLDGSGEIEFFEFAEWFTATER